MNVLSRQFSQILIHILFWSLFIFTSLFLFSSFYWIENPFLQYLFILLVIVYTNNWLLLPFFVGKKWYGSYIIVIAIISVLATQLYCYVFAQCGCTLFKCLSDYLWQTLVPLAFLSFVWMLYRYLDKQDEIEKIKQEHTEMELKFLKSQINPHVLFNNLNTIYSYSLEKPAETPELILMLSDHLKHVLYESNSEKIPLKKEFHFLDNYIKFQKIRTEGIKKVNYELNVDSENYEIAPLLLITIFENAFKHSSSNSDINISLGLGNNELTCICENNYDKEKINVNNFSIGLQNLEKRLTLLYPNKHEFKITDDETFKVFLKLVLV